MPQGDKSSYTAKQKRQAEHIEEGYQEKGMPEKKAERIAWATVNKQDGGGLKKKTKTRTASKGTESTAKTSTKTGTSHKTTAKKTTKAGASSKKTTAKKSTKTGAPRKTTAKKATAKKSTEKK